MKPHYGFRVIWWLSNLLLAAALVSTVWTGIWELSVRRYLRGFSDAVVPEASSPREKIEAILAWMQNGPPRLTTSPGIKVSPRDPEDTLNYRQLLDVCGSATNAFLNLSRSAGVESRRLLLMTPERVTKHVVAEVNVDGRWVIVDATYRALLKDDKGNLLTRRDLQNPELFRQATGVLPDYRPEYTYENFAHVRVSALPLQGARVRVLLDKLFPDWEEYLDWSLLLERRSFMYFFLSINVLLFLIVVRLALGWIADRRLRIPRFHLRANLSRATAAFFTSPEIK
ncbi:MAG TPA: transglutaminase-like domain-containing protein [Methylomirabilota bacterium]|nr:transglutaminase-like domain-containing protein [Methylomirabilota bacterium]